MWYSIVALVLGSTSPGQIALENAALRMVVGRTKGPAIVSLVHKGSGRELAAPAGAKNLFAIVLANPDGATETIESSQARQTALRLEPDGDGRRLVIECHDFAAGDLRVEVVARCRPGDPLLRWSVRLENRTGRRAVAVRSPMIAATPAIGQPGDDFLVLPYLPGTLVENPAQEWRPGMSLSLDYPGSLSAQFLAYQDRTAGVYLAGMDPEGFPMKLAVAKRPEGFLLSHEYALPGDAGENWSSPYPVALSVTQGTWCDTADLYKQWALGQPWCVRTLAERRDVPDWWKQGPDVHVCTVHNYDARRVSIGSYYPKMPEHLQYLRQQIGGPVVVMLAGWENHRRWTAGDYFPIFDEKNALPIIAQIRAAGFHPFFYLSGLFYTYENEGADGGPIPSAEQYRPWYVVDRKTGQARQFSLDESSPGSTWRRHSYEFCVRPPQTREFFRGVIDRAHAAGVDVLQMDQVTGGAGNACYATNHGHAPGPGLYQSRAFRELLADMRSYGKSKTRDFVLFHEEPHEQLIQCLDGIHTREYMEKTWYRWMPGSRAIPLFSYLYHEYAIAYGGDSAGFSKRNDRLLVRAHAVNLVTGRTAGGCLWSDHQILWEAHTDQLKMIRNHCRLLATRAGRYLMLGRMLHPYELDVPRVKFQVEVHSKKGRRTEELEDRAVLTSSWQSPEGGVGHLLVNISEARQPLALQLDTRNAPAWKKCRAEIYRSEQAADFRPLWPQTELPRALSLELSPLEVAFIEIRP